MPATLDGQSRQQLATRPGTDVLPGVEIHSASSNDYPYTRFADGSTGVYRPTREKLDEVVRNFYELYDGASNGTRLKPIATVRHLKAKGIAETDPRCHGVAARDLRRDGDKLVVSFVDVPAATRAAIRRGELRNASAEILPEFSDRGRDFGAVLYRVAWLGHEQPRDKGIAELPFADEDGDARPLDVVLCFADPVPIPEAAAVTTPAEPTPAPAANPAPPVAPTPDPRLDKLLAFADRLPELLSFADSLPALQAQIDRAKTDAATASRLEADRLDREKRDKVKRFLDSPGLCFADDSGRVRVLPCQRSFFEDALLREDAGAVLTFADGDKQIQGTALDRKMAEIRKFPPQLDFSEKMRQPTPGDQGGAVPSPADRDRILSLTPMGKGILQRERERAALALPAAK